MKRENEKTGGVLSRIAIGTCLTVLGIVFAVLAWIFYAQNGITEFNVSLESSAISFLIIGIVLSAVSLAADFLPFSWGPAAARPLRYAAYLTELYAFLMFIYSQVTYIANVLVSIDGNSFSAGFILTAVFYVLAAGVTLAAAITSKTKPWAGKDGGNTKSEVLQ